MPGSSPLMLADVEVLDTKTGNFRPRSDLVLAEGRIAPGELRPASIRTIDAARLSALPGFVDAHFHCTYSGHVGIAQLEDGSAPDAVVARATKNASTALAHGITSVLDVGSHGRAAVQIRDAIARGEIPGPRMRASGQIIVKAGGVLDGWRVGTPSERLFRVVNNMSELEVAIHEHAAWGVDAIKLQISASAVQTDAPPDSCDFSRAELIAAVRTASRYGLLLSVHAEGDPAILEAARAGVDVIQHATFASRHVLRALASAGTGIVFTLGVYRAILRNGERVGYPADAMQRVARHWEAITTTVRDALELGVPFGVGSDCGGKVHPHGDYLSDVISLVTEVGLTPGRAIAAATRGSALATRLSGGGEIRIGAPADVVLVPSDLLRKDVSRLLDPRNFTVIKAGEVVTEAALA